MAVHHDGPTALTWSCACWGSMYTWAMALVEVLTLTVGNAVAKWIFGAWLGEGLDKELAGSSVDTITAKIPNFIQRRSLERQQEMVAERTAEKLERVIEIEFANLNINEQTAAVHAAADTMSKTLPDTNLFTVDLDPAGLQLHLLAQDAGRSEVAGLSHDAERLYRLVLLEAATYVTEVVTTLPAFTAASSVELLRRDSAIIELVTEVLRRLPDPHASVASDQVATLEFETNYRRFIARKLDKLELFGVSVSEYSSRYALSVAYITLTAKSIRPERQAEPDDTTIEVPTSALKEDSGDELLRIDDAISQSSRVFVRGAAGSGKTTLLQWIAVRSARSEFDSRKTNGTSPSRSSYS
jgi:hypothetical protein